MNSVSKISKKDLQLAIGVHRPTARRKELSVRVTRQGCWVNNEFVNNCSTTSYLEKRMRTASNRAPITMASLHATIESDDELPELSTVFGVARTRQKKLESKHQNEREVDGNKQAKIQKPLGLAHMNSLLLPKVIPSTRSPTKAKSTWLDDGKSTNLRDIPRRTAVQKVDIKAFAAELRNTLESTDEDASFDDLSDFIVNDSASDEELRRPKSIKRVTKSSPKKAQENRAYGRDIDTENFHKQLQQPPTFVDLISPDKTSGTATSEQVRHASIEHILPEAFLNKPDASLRL